MVKSTALVRRAFYITVLLTVVGCESTTSLAEKTSVRKEGYPSLSIKQKAATEQFTETQRQMLIDKLEKEATRVKALSEAQVVDSFDLMEVKEDAHHEVEKVLKQIEQSGNQ